LSAADGPVQPSRRELGLPDFAAKPDGKLPENILHFARALREAGLPLGPGAVLDALAAVAAAGIGTRAEFHDVLQAVFVKRHEQSLIFDQAFAIFWRRKGYVEKLLAMMSPKAMSEKEKKSKADAGATRVADALFKNPREDERAALICAKSLLARISFADIV
jgi:uncharacterized protein